MPPVLARRAISIARRRPGTARRLRRAVRGAAGARGAIAPDSPADDAGFEPGCYVTTMDGKPVPTSSARWLAATAASGGAGLSMPSGGVVELEREEGEDWGFGSGVVFDGVRQCRLPPFCFLPFARPCNPPLTLRDDPIFAEGFLAGTFVVPQPPSPKTNGASSSSAISPLHLSLHVADPEVRRRMIGKHAQRGIDVLGGCWKRASSSTPRSCINATTRTTTVLEDLAWATARPSISRRVHRCRFKDSRAQASSGPQPGDPVSVARGDGHQSFSLTARSGQARRHGPSRPTQVLSITPTAPSCCGPAAVGALRRLRHVRGRRGHHPLVR